MDEENTMIVDYQTWCKKCKFEKCKEYVMPCFECLDQPVNCGTTRPIKFEPKG